jgi:hypothetical protein
MFIGNAIALSRGAIKSSGESEGIPGLIATLSFLSGKPSSVDDTGAVAGFVQKTDNLFELISSGLRRSNRGALVEPARTQLVSPSDLNNASWAKSNLPTVNPKTGVVPGLSAYEFVSNGTTGVLSGPTSVAGTFGATPECIWAIIETTATSTSFYMSVENSTGSTTECVITATNLLTTPSVSATSANASTNKKCYIENLGAGPNGGILFLVAGIYTPSASGGSRRYRLRPNSSNPAASVAIIVHYFGGEVGAYPTSPVITTSGTATRNGDVVEVDVPDDTYAVQFKLYHKDEHSETVINRTIVASGGLVVPTDLVDTQPITTDQAAGVSLLTDMRVGHITQMSIWEPADDLHLLGDSFVGTATAFLVKWIPRKVYRPRTVTIDGLSGSSVTAMNTRFSSDTGSHGKVVVIVDGGRNTGESFAQIKSAVDSINSQLTVPGRFVFIQAFPNGIAGNEQGTSYYTDYLALEAQLSAEYPNNYCPTLSTMQSQGSDGSANDLSDIANGWVPRSCTLDGLHPNNKGARILATIISNFIQNKGW